MVCTESDALIRELTCPCMHYKQHARCSDAKYEQSSDTGRSNYDRAVMSPIWTEEVLVLIFDYFCGMLAIAYTWLHCMLPGAHRC